MYAGRSVPQTGISQREHSPFQDEALPPNTSKYTKIVSPQIDYYEAMTNSIYLFIYLVPYINKRTFTNTGYFKVMNVLGMGSVPVTALVYFVSNIAETSLVL